MFVNLENLQIARENAGYSTLEATQKVCGKNIKSDRVVQWETGERYPTWQQLKKLADAYQTNVFLLTSKEKLARTRAIPDYRKKEMGGELELNAKKFILFLLQRQKYLAHIMKNEGMQKNPLVGIVKEPSNAKDVAQFIAGKIGYQYKKSRKDHLRDLISLLERKGIFVMKSLSCWTISVKNMEGVYLKDQYAPVIGLNRNKYITKTKQLFTLAHEVAHLFINSEGVSNIDFRNQSSDPTERFCNAVAANLLLPENSIEKRQHYIDDIERIAERLQISEECVFYRLKNLALLNKEDIPLMERRIKEKSDALMKAKASKKSGGDYANNMKDSNGHLFNKFISSLYFEHKINAAEASKILKLSIDKV